MKTDIIQINGKSLNAKAIQEKLNQKSMPEWEKDIYEFILNWFNDSDFIIQQTSGSTGEPKPIKLRKSSMIASAKKTINFFNLKESSTAWLCLPINYIAGKMMVVRAIVGKLNLIISEPVGTPVIPDQEIQFTAMVPLQVQKLIDEKNDFTKIDKLIIGGAAVDYDLQKQLQLVPTEMYATYGMTETCSHIALQKLNGDEPDSNFKVLAGIKISANDENCLIINASDLLETELVTNDIVNIISPTEFEIIGRKDNIINSGGIKISPEQLEKEISEIIHRECLIIPEKDELLGQRIVMVIEKSEVNTSEENFISQIKLALGKHRTPKAVYFVKQFPRTTSMKINRLETINQLKFNQ